jgi:hypothetical protein
MPSLEPRLPIPITTRPIPAAGSLRSAAPLALLVLFALLAAAILTSQPRFAIAVPAAAIGAVACAWRPTVAVLAIFVLTATTNTLPALTPIPNGPLTDFLLAGLWLGVVGTYLSGRAERSFWLWPALIATILYLTLTGIEALMVSPVSYGLTAFKAAAWYMSGILLVAAAPWSADTHRRIARGIVVVSIVVGLYSLYRFLGAPSPEETAAARVAQPGLAPSVQARFFGSWLTANQLAGWVATVLPLLVALGLAWRGRWRLLALAAVVPLAIALFDSDVRTGIIAVGVGALVVFTLYLVTPAFPGRLAAGVAGLMIAIAIGAAGYGLTVGTSGERADRFSGILSPGQDKAFSDRQQTWAAAFEDMKQTPWGHGLGSAGGVAVTNGNQSVSSNILDSSYIKVGLEQGFLIMVLYVGAMVILLLALALRATRSTNRQSAALMIGACGSLAAALVLFYTGLYSEGLPILATWLIVGLGVSQVTIHDQGPVRITPADW